MMIWWLNKVILRNNLRRMERSGSMMYLQDSIGHVENVGSQCHPLQQVSRRSLFAVVDFARQASRYCNRR